MPYQLVVIKGRSANQALKIPADGVTTVGRQQGCQIRIGSSQVSRKHCELFEKQGLLLVKDLNSSNGTIVNGKKVQGQQVLEPGNILLIGTVAFRVEQAGAPAAAPGGKRPTDTAVTQPVAVGGEEDIELDFDLADDENTVATPAPSRPAPAARPEAAPAAQPKAAPAARPKAAPAARPEAPAATPPAPAVAAAAAADPEADTFLTTDPSKEVGEDAVAEYLLNIDLDDDDKL